MLGGRILADDRFQGLEGRGPSHGPRFPHRPSREARTLGLDDFSHALLSIDSALYHGLTQEPRQISLLQYRDCYPIIHRFHAGMRIKDGFSANSFARIASGRGRTWLARPATQRPGLRREELGAQGGGISSTWVALGSSRVVRCKPRLKRWGAWLGALALTRRGTRLLVRPGRPLSTARRHPEPEADAPTSLLDAVKAVAHPAYALDPLWNACCWNTAAARLFSRLAGRRPSAQPVALRLP